MPQPKVGTVAYNKCADRRVESRLQVLDLAKKYHSILLSIPEVRNLLLDSIPGTRKDNFTEE